MYLYIFPGVFSKKIGTILSASIPKYVTDINGCSVQAFPGATIGRLSNLVANGTVNLKHIDFLIIHVGSNNIAIHQSVNQIISFYGDLIHYIKCKTSAQIVFTSILPRLCDFHQTERMVTKVNAELKSLCKRKHISFSNIYRSFLYKNKPDPSLFAPKDHLHLNFSGTALLRKKFINIIKHLRV